MLHCGKCQGCLGKENSEIKIRVGTFGVVKAVSVLLPSYPSILRRQGKGMAEVQDNWLGVFLTVIPVLQTSSWHPWAAWVLSARKVADSLVGMLLPLSLLNWRETSPVTSVLDGACHYNWWVAGDANLNASHTRQVQEAALLTGFFLPTGAQSWPSQCVEIMVLNSLQGTRSLGSILSSVLDLRYDLVQVT